MFRKNENFEHKMSRNEKILGWLYLAVHIVIIPILFDIYVGVGGEIDETKANVIYYGIGVIYILVLMRRYLRTEFDTLLDNKLVGFVSIVAAYFIYTVLAYAALFALSVLIGEIDNPNNNAVESFASVQFGPTFGVAVFMVPIVEETLFRGVIFGSLQKKSRALAYVISAAAFALYHVWRYAVGYRDAAFLLYGLQYIPPAVALAWCYERSGSIWTAMLFHAGINAVSLMYMK